MVLEEITFVDNSSVFSIMSLQQQNLTLYHTIPTLNDPGKKAFRQHCEKRRKSW